MPCIRKILIIKNPYQKKLLYDKQEESVHFGHECIVT